MKKIVSLLIVMILCISCFVTVSADTIKVDFGDLAGKAGDVDVDTYLTAADLSTLRKVLVGALDAQSENTANVNKDSEVDILDLVRLKKMMADAQTAYLAQGTTTICGSPSDKTTWMYKMNDSGLYVRESDIDLGTGNNELVITHLSDFHLVGTSEEEMKDNELANSYNSRKSSFANQVRNAQKALEFASYGDKTIITGDATDYLSKGALMTLKDLIGNSNTNVCVGNHEARKVWYGSYLDTVSEDIRNAQLQSMWPWNNIYYHSEVLRDRVMIIMLYNGTGAGFQQYYDKAFTYNGETGTMDYFLSKDIETAKKNGYAVLLFEHCPIYSGNSADATLSNIEKTGSQNFKDKYVGSNSGLTQSAVDNAVYKLITENAAVIKSIYCGHTHANFYNEIKAKSTPASATYDAVIPQNCITCNAYNNGIALKITVKY